MTFHINALPAGSFDVAVCVRDKIMLRQVDGSAVSTYPYL